jgi:hypothetical protein
MICQSCKDANAPENPNPELHNMCENSGKIRPHDGGQDTTWCDCHHRVGGTRAAIQEEVVKQMVERGRPIIPPADVSHREL